MDQRPIRLAIIQGLLERIEGQVTAQGAQTGDNLEGILASATYGSADPSLSNPYGFARPAFGF